MSKMTLAAARGMLGWTPEQLAAEAGEKPSNVRDIEAERNKRPAYVLVMRLVKALQRGGLAGISSEDIFPIPELPPRPEVTADRRSGTDRRAADASTAGAV